MTPKSLGDRIKELRLEAGLSLRQLATKAAITPPFLSDIELGRRFPSEEVLNTLAMLLNVSTEELKKCDVREPISQMKKMVQGDARWGLAFRTVAEKFKSGELTPDQLIKQVSKGSKK